MRSMYRGIALGVGLSIGRILYAALGFFLGLVAVVALGMVILNHWILGAAVFIAGCVVHDWLLRLVVRED